MNFLRKKKNLTLILGGTGKTGRRIAERLKAKGHEVRVGSRSAVPSFDWDNEKGWDAALKDVTAVYITYALISPCPARLMRSRPSLISRSGAA